MPVNRQKNSNPINNDRFDKIYLTVYVMPDTHYYSFISPNNLFQNCPCSCFTKTDYKSERTKQITMPMALNALYHT